MDIHWTEHTCCCTMFRIIRGSYALLLLVNWVKSGVGALLVRETSFKRGQICHEKESGEIAKERYLAPNQNRLDTHPASPNVRHIVICQSK